MEDQKEIKILTDAEAIKLCNEQLFKENPNALSEESLDLLEEFLREDQK